MQNMKNSQVINRIFSVWEERANEFNLHFHLFNRGICCVYDFSLIETQNFSLETLNLSGK